MWYPARTMLSLNRDLLSLKAWSCATFVETNHKQKVVETITTPGNASFFHALRHLSCDTGT